MVCSPIFTPLLDLHAQGLEFYLWNTGALLLNAYMGWRKLSHTVKDFPSLTLLYLFYHISLLQVNFQFHVEVAPSLPLFCFCSSYKLLIRSTGLTTFSIFAREVGKLLHSGILIFCQKVLVLSFSFWDTSNCWWLMPRSMNLWGITKWWYCFLLFFLNLLAEILLWRDIPSNILFGYPLI